LRPGESGCHFFLLIVFIFAPTCAWKTGVFIWIPRTRSGWIAQPLPVYRQSIAARRFLHGCGKGETGCEEKDNKYKEKTVVPVVHAGKVDILPK
jgi:hypothetical protein